MKTNVGSYDAGARFILSCLVIGGSVNGFGWWALLGVPLLLSAALQYCPVYHLFHFNTVDWEDHFEGRHRH